ncbi:MAG: spore coat protein [Pelosinus sp.]|nr:spore coat protein [Pelosinus sp.]
MTSFMGSIFSNVAEVPSADQTIAYSAAGGAAASAQAYLTAALAATTPEVRRLFSEYASQSLMGNEAMMGLMINNGWVNPYDPPEKQLQSILNQQSAPTQNH